MISYAQNFEDVMLWRALKHIENGFYIDIGAWSPDLDSVTRHFYENGWSGINVEPNPEFYEQYLIKRSKDINLKVAVSDRIGEVDIFFSSNPGLSSLDENIARSHHKLGFETTMARVEVSTLNDICSKYCLEREIHFLKIDIEGYELNALRGNDWGKFRPWIVVVEATLPMSQLENYGTWEYILLEANYEFIYADGLNRFYVAQEHEELKSNFKYPPNVFDQFILANQMYAEQRANTAEFNLLQECANRDTEINRLDQECANRDAEINRLDQECANRDAEINRLNDNINSIYNTFSWKITKPIRLVKKLIMKNFVKG